MKCHQCSTDAPPETDSQSGRLRCPQCDTFFGTAATQPAVVQQARDILQKWSTADVLDQISSFTQVPPLAEPVRSEQLPTIQSLPEESTQINPSGARLNVHSDHLVRTVLPEPDGEKLSAGEMTDEAADLLSLMASVQDTESVAAVAEAKDELQKPSENSLPQNVPQLSMTEADDLMQLSDSKDGMLTMELRQAESSGSAASSDPEPTKKQHGRQLARPLMKRRSIQAASQTTTVQQRSEILQKGMDAVEKLRVDRPGNPAPASDIVTQTEETAAVDTRAQDSAATRRIRVDSAEQLLDLTDSGGRVRGHSRAQQRYIDEPHASSGLRGPHFEVSPPQRSSLTSLTGQFLAYVGVLGLTVGTAIVIYGHFGGYSEYTPTGWLVTTVAQMLLFLGVINLVSGGIEQNNNDLSRRISVLGEQLVRIEQVAESVVRGPKIPAERYAGTATVEDASENEAVCVDD